jgi:hypothetical protein
MYVLNYQSIIRQVMLGVLCALGVLTARAVQADDVNSATTTSGVTSVPAGGAFVTFIQTTISTPGPRELVIHYFTECEVSGGGTTGFIDYDIRLVGAPSPIRPTNDADSALCKANQNDVSVGTVVFQPVGAGTHTIQVRGRMFGPGTGVIDDQSLVIEEEAP